MEVIKQRNRKVLKMKIYEYPSKSAEKRIEEIINRGLSFREEDLETVSRIIKDVKKDGDKALVDYTNRFDAPGLTVDSLEVTEQEMDEAEQIVDESFVNAMNLAAAQIEDFHRHQIEKSWISLKRPGVFLGQMVNPVDAVGVYVPGAKGGKTPLVSSVLMGAIPAKIAGVKSITVVTPPTEDGKVAPHILAAAKKAGVHRVFKVGSAWAIAALAFGTSTIPRVDVIVGPGNIYVTLAKKLVSGTVGIDMIAGPSEILVIADNSANPEYIAADMLSQAEHDSMASALMITDSKEIALAVAKTIKIQLGDLDRKDIAEKSLASFGGIIKVPELDKAIEIANRIAPEHLELQVREPFDHVGKIRNAGAVFMGNHTPEPVGDYVAGPNHVLPTAGTARFASALSVENFIKKTSLIHYSASAFEKEAAQIIKIAETEGLGAHANSVRVRLR